MAPLGPLIPGRCWNCGERRDLETCSNCGLTRAEDIQVHDELLLDVPARELVQGVHIHLVREPDGGRIREFDSRVIGYASAGAVAQLLCERGLISKRGRDRVMGEGDVIHGAAPTDPEGWWTPHAKLAK